MAAGGAHTDGSGLLNAAGSSAKSEDPARTALPEKKRRKKAAKTAVQHKIKSIIHEAKELVRHGSMQEAIVTYDWALEAIQWKRAVLLQKSGQLNAAYDAYIQVLDLNPDRTGCGSGPARSCGSWAGQMKFRNSSAV
jgi:hypothetical protein